MSQLSAFWVVIVVTCHLQQISGSDRSFKIDYDNNQFLKDGQPFRYISGSMHYFRVPYPNWEDRMKKMLYAGLNAVQTDVYWSQHEPVNGTYNFNITTSDNLDLIQFIKTAQYVGLLVILRVGPYVGADLDLGGLPFWLLQENATMKLRSNDTSFLKHVDAWFNTLLPMIKPYLYAYGGPIIAVQIENEYGNVTECNFNYTTHLRDLVRSLLGENVVLFTSDAPSRLRCGKIPDVYATVEFGSDVSASDGFSAQRQIETKGPLVNSAYYVGSNDYWAYPHDNTNLWTIIGYLNEILARNASVNLYMFVGGTNFGFTNGANLRPDYVSVPTSYDYNAPVSETGDLTPKFFEIRNLLASYVKVPPTPPPGPVPKMGFGHIDMKPIGSLFDILPQIRLTDPLKSQYPVTFESLGQASGFVLYETVISGQFIDPAILDAGDVRDRALVFVDQFPVGILSRQKNMHTVAISIQNGQNLSILVENMGRIISSDGLTDQKGLLSNVTLNGTILTNWNITQLPLNATQIALVEKLIKSKSNVNSKPWTLLNRLYTPGFFVGSFAAPKQYYSGLDTYLNATGWHKGVAFVNGYNIGRYWPIVGPQITLYVPQRLQASYPFNNELILFELEYAPCYGDLKCLVQLDDTHVINSTTPYLN